MSGAAPAVPKVVDLDALAEWCAKRRDAGERVVHCHGVFDLVHPGHIRHLEAAADQGDALVVTVVADPWVDKGPDRPFFNQRLRADTLAALACVDRVAVSDASSAADAIRKLRPAVYVQGSAPEDAPADVLERLEQERSAAGESGAELHVTEVQAFSSTHLLNTHFDVLSPEATTWLREFAQRYSADEVIAALRDLRDLRVLVLGDSIIDEYSFCRAYGKASKSSAISAQHLREEAYAGGVLAVANHLAGFCDDVHLVTCLGDQDSRRDFVEAALKPNVSRRLFSRPDAPTVIKKRFVEGFLMTKFFELSLFNDTPLPAETEARVAEHIDAVAGDYDLVLVADFGHGFMTERLVERSVERARYLAVNTQLNSINMGYNLITQYPRADYVCIDEQETRMAARDRRGPLLDLVERLATGLDCHLMTTTRGKSGALVRSRDGTHVTAPVLSRDVVDTIGAGDAFLSITSPCAARDYDPALIGFVGNAVGALAVRIVGNRESVEPEPLYRFIRTLLRR